MIKIVLVHVTSKIILCYHLPTRGRAGVKLGDAWYVSNVSIIFNVPCLFLHHLLSVYTFSGTNLLTRCHSVSSLFSDVFVFQKSYTGNILGIGRNKSRTSYYLPKLLEVQREDGGGPRADHTIGQHGQPLGHAPYGWGHPGPPLTLPLAYKDPPTGKT
jgi:hypothetical protein